MGRRRVGCLGFQSPRAVLIGSRRPAVASSACASATGRDTPTRCSTSSAPTKVRRGEWPVRDPERPPNARRVFRLSGGRSSVERDVDDEIRFHIEERVADLVRRGWNGDAARQAAMHEYGDVASSQRELAEVDHRRLGRRRRREGFMSTWDDLRYSARSLLRRPALMAISVSALTISIAANAVMFGVIDQLMLRPPSGVAAPDQVKRIYFSEHRDKEIRTGSVTSYPMVAAIQSGAPSLDLAAYDRGESHTLGLGADAREVKVQVVSGNYFGVLGVVLPAGRAFTVAEDDPSNPTPVAVVSDAFWRGELGEAHDAIGKSVTIDGSPFTIIGIAPPKIQRHRSRADGHVGADERARGQEFCRVDVALERALLLGSGVRPLASGSHRTASRIARYGSISQ